MGLPLLLLLLRRRLRFFRVCARWIRLRRNLSRISGEADAVDRPLSMPFVAAAGMGRASLAVVPLSRSPEKGTNVVADLGRLAKGVD